MNNKFLSLKKNQAVIILFTSILVAFVFLRLAIGVFGRVPPDEYRYLTDMTVEVLHENGKVDTFNSNMFNYSSKNDKITIHLPLDESFKNEHQSVNFLFYNSVIKAYYKDELLASYGENLSRHMIGHLKVTVPVPIEAYGDEIRIVIEPALDILEDTFEPPILMKESNEAFFPIIGQETYYIIFSVVMFASFFIAVIFAFFYRLLDYAREGLWLMLLIFAITLWYMGNSGMIYMVTANENLNAISEYIGMYLLLPSAPLYASFETERPRNRKYLRRAGTVLFIVFVVLLILYILPTGYNYVYHLRFGQALQIVMVFSALVNILLPGKKARYTSEYVIKYGLVLVAASGVLEQARIILAARITEETPKFAQGFAEARFAQVLIIVLSVTFVSSYVFKVSNIIQRSLKDKHLEMLAYTDNLTNLGNRQYLQRKLDLLDKDNKDDYAVIFMDINDLKYTNDEFGHDCGDQLIKMVALAIKDAVDETGGFVGRNGGDEFIGVVIPAKKVSSVIQDIRDNLTKASGKKKVPFPVSVSIGSATYSEVVAEIHKTSNITVTTSDVIREADAKMYEDKYKQKRERNWNALL